MSLFFPDSPQTLWNINEYRKNRGYVTTSSSMAVFNYYHFKYYHFILPVHMYEHITATIGLSLIHLRTLLFSFTMSLSCFKFRTPRVPFLPGFLLTSKHFSNSWHSFWNGAELQTSRAYVCWSADSGKRCTEFHVGLEFVLGLLSQKQYQPRYCCLLWKAF